MRRGAKVVALIGVVLVGGGLPIAATASSSPAEARAPAITAPSAGDRAHAAPQAIGGETVTYGGGGLEPLVPSRLLDTRSGNGAPAAKIGPGGVIDLHVTGRGGIPATGVGAVVLNVTAVDATAWSYVTVWPTGAPQPDASNLNIEAGDTIPNLVIAKVGTGGNVSLYNYGGDVHLLADVVGWFPEGTGLEPLVPSRLLDTRSGNGAPAAKIGPGGVIDLHVTGRGGIPATGVGAVVLNVTAVDATAWSYVTVWPTGAPQPDASNLNIEAGDTIPNLVIAKVGTGGNVSLYNYGGDVHLLADVVGWFPEGTGLEPLVPSRLLDTRSGNGAPAAKIGPGGVIDLHVTGRGGIPATGVGAVVLNVTAVDATAWSYVTVWPTGAPQPDASNLNIEAGDTIPNLVIAKVGTGGNVSLYNYGGDVHLLADVVGWFPEGTGSSTTMSLAAGTVLAGAGDVVSFTGDSDVGATVTLAASADMPPVGGHLSVLPHAAVPSGLSGRVTTATRAADGTTVVTLVPANLQDIFADLKISGDVDIVRQAVPEPTGTLNAVALGVTPAASAAAPLAISCSTGGELGFAEPEVSIGNYGGSADFDLWAARARVVVTAEASVTWAIQANFEAACEVEFPTVLVAVIGPLTFELGLELQFWVSATSAINLQATAPVSLGFSYDDGTATNLSHVDLAGTTSEPGITAEVAASVAAFADLDVKVAGIGGVEISFGPQLTLAVQGLCVELIGELIAGIEVEIGRWGAEWEFELEDVSIGSKTLFQDGCGLEWVGTMQLSNSWNNVGGAGHDNGEWSGQLADISTQSQYTDQDGSTVYRLVADRVQVSYRQEYFTVVPPCGDIRTALHEGTATQDSIAGWGSGDDVVADLRVTPQGDVFLLPYHAVFTVPASGFGCGVPPITGGEQAVEAFSYYLGNASEAPSSPLVNIAATPKQIAASASYSLGNPPADGMPQGYTQYAFNLSVNLVALE